MFSIKQILNNARTLRNLVPSFRAMSSSQPLVGIDVDNEGIATVTMQKLPVNTLNLEILQKLSNAFDQVEKDKCKGMVLTSSSPTVFSAGLDIMEMYKPDMKRVETFYTTLQEVWIKLFGSNFVTAAAINGHAPAAGCLLAMSCEYRVMVNGNYTIGLNESAFGMFITQWFIYTMTYTISQRQAELALTTGKMFKPDEALKVGLIDEIATDKADSVDKCKKFIKKFDRIPPLARAITKQKIREAPLAWMEKNRELNKQDFLISLSDPEIQQALHVHIQNLKKNSKK